ncbi:hypothetical protein OQA88_3141 [Cercophora sp. LCS_1]
MGLGLLNFLTRGVSFNPAKDIPSLKGKVILVTGGNSGLGKQSIIELAPHEPELIWLCARGEARAQAVIDDVRKTVPNANIKPLDLDLASFESIKNAARRVAAESDRLDVLMLNAGIMATPAGQTKEGYELQFGTNHVGHALLTKLLLPLLEKTAEQPASDVRVIVLSSVAHLGAPSGGILFDSLKSEQASVNTIYRYGQSKLANVLFAVEMARRYPKIKTIALHPGAVISNLATPFSNSYAFLKPFVWLYMTAFAVSVEDGVKNQLWATVSSDAKSGEYYMPVGSNTGASALSKDEELAKKLWEWTEKELEDQTL